MSGRFSAFRLQKSHSFLLAPAGLKAPEELADYTVEGLENALAVPKTQVRVFGKPITKAGRRMAVALSAADTVETARENAKKALDQLTIK